VIRGQRVRLRALRREDAAMMAAWVSEPEVMVYVMPQFPRTVMKQEQVIEQLAVADEHAPCIIELNDGTPIGRIGLHRIDWRNRQAMLDLAIHRPEHRGQGHGTDALRALLHHAFHHMGLRRVWLEVYDDNERAIRVYRKCGFGLEARLQAERWRDGGWRDTLLMAVMGEDFLAGRPTPDTVELLP